jgi:hypothetical protein
MKKRTGYNHYHCLKNPSITKKLHKENVYNGQVPDVQTEKIRDKFLLEYSFMYIFWIIRKNI